MIRKYLVTKKKLPDGRGGLMVLIIAVGVVIILLGVYVAVKKRTKPLDKNTLKMLYINYLCKDFEGDSKFLMNPMG